MPRVAAVVPAFNEQETLAEVLTVLKSTGHVDEVLVVSDGSTDETVEIARQLGVKTLHLRRNYGKALAMSIGVAHTDAEIVLFVDGDILNLSEYLLDQLITPVVEGEADMVIGVRHRGWLLDLIHRNFGPLLSGLRCLRREIFESVPEEYLKGYTVETALNWTCAQLGQRSETVVLPQPAPRGQGEEARLLDRPQGALRHVQGGVPRLAGADLEAPRPAPRRRPGPPRQPGPRVHQLVALLRSAAPTAQLRACRVAA